MDRPAPRVPLVPDETTLPREGRPTRAPAVPGQVSPLRALAGAAVAVAGVALGIGALLTVSGEPGGSPVVAGESDALAGPPAVDAAPAPVEPADTAAVAPTPVDLPASTPAQPTTTAPPRAVAPAPVAAAPRRTPAARRVVAARPAVTVLNNSTRTGLADRAARRFTQAGWPVRLTGNFRGKLRATTVYYEPGQRAAAQRFAATFRGVPRVLPRAANIPGPRGLVVVLTRDFPA